MLDIIIPEKMPKQIFGMWQDTVMEIKNGKIVDTEVMPANRFLQSEEIIDKHGQSWKKNTIMDINSALLASMYADLAGYNGLTFMALGNGDPNWDTLPTIPPVITSGILKQFQDVDVTPATDIIAINAHGLANDQKVFFTTTGTLPSPLDTVTPYFIINSNANDFQVSTSISGSAVDITSAAGGGIHNVGVISGNRLEVEFFRKSLDSVIFLDSGDNPITFDPTVRKIESACTYLESEANGESIREFGLFGGDATSTLNSGLISNNIRHREIFKTATIRLLRKVRYSL